MAVHVISVTTTDGVHVFICHRNQPQPSAAVGMVTSSFTESVTEIEESFLIFSSKLFLPVSFGTGVVRGCQLGVSPERGRLFPQTPEQSLGGLPADLRLYVSQIGDGLAGGSLVHRGQSVRREPEAKKRSAESREDSVLLACRKPPLESLPPGTEWHHMRLQPNQSDSTIVVVIPADECLLSFHLHHHHPLHPHHLSSSRNKRAALRRFHLNHDIDQQPQRSGSEEETPPQCEESRGTPSRIRSALPQ
ncbi:unnamed protein product [Pleuronectes platessa]|uniref:Uncharacterized protein n=1 Tax=Pleuronectes platessa TaxID=8262 RepID=A0A9N7YII0_PLEPL|nr:unnamed protein product [Pleuronectes platessa]